MVAVVAAWSSNRAIKMWSEGAVVACFDATSVPE